jgi:lysozyme
MQTSTAGKELIKTSEGFDPVPRNDEGHLVWGHGHDQNGNEPVPSSITLAQADALLDVDLAARYEPALNRHIPPQCNQNQFDALMDFCYEFNEGGAKELLAHGWEQVTTQLLFWCHAKVNGVETAIPGILARRQKEVALFNTPV